MWRREKWFATAFAVCGQDFCRFGYCACADVRANYSNEFGCLLFYILYPVSMSSSSVMVELGPLPLRFAGDFSGEEKIPSMGSRPCSSRIPVSLRVIPVFLFPVSDELS